MEKGVANEKKPHIKRAKKGKFIRCKKCGERVSEIKQYNKHYCLDCMPNMSIFEQNLNQLEN